MKGAYIAIGYMCNEHCSFCPCSDGLKHECVMFPTSELIDRIEKLKCLGIERLTISGGEPTLHKDFIDIIAYTQNIGLEVFVLSNSERFCDKDFVGDMSSKVDMKKLRLITTLHSQTAAEHEKANCTSGSYKRTIGGLDNMIAEGVDVTIKHCITKSNYKELFDFYVYYDKRFPESVDIQLCSIDYCGIDKELLEQHMLTFTELRPYLEQMFDMHIKREQEGSKRKIYCINMPLCSADVFYWRFMTLKNKSFYERYIDPVHKDIQAAEEMTEAQRAACGDCKVRHLCPGTYKTAFEYFGKKLIKPYK